jgi:hypothetical protein
LSIEQIDYDQSNFHLFPHMDNTWNRQIVLMKEIDMNPILPLIEE